MENPKQIVRNLVYNFLHVKKLVVTKLVNPLRLVVTLRDNMSFLELSLSLHALFKFRKNFHEIDESLRLTPLCNEPP